MSTAAASAANPRLSPEQVAAYRRDGYLLPTQPVFPPERFLALRSLFEDLLARWTRDTGCSSPEHMDVPHFFEPRLYDFLLDDAVLDLVQPLIGPDIALFSSHFICKPAGTGKRVPWHEDSAYWKGRLDPMEVVTVWLAIDDSAPENACMRVIPGSHRAGRAGFSDYRPVADRPGSVFDSEIEPGQVDEIRAVDCVLRAGQCSLHDGRLIHGSDANRSARRRCGYTMRFMPASVRHAPRDGFGIVLARGRDRAGNDYLEPGRRNQAWIDRHPRGWPQGH